MSWQEKGNGVSLLNSKCSLSLFIKEQVAENSTILDTAAFPSLICASGKVICRERHLQTLLRELK